MARWMSRVFILVTLALLVLPQGLSAPTANLTTWFNPFTGRLDYIVDSATIGNLSSATGWNLSGNNLSAASNSYNVGIGTGNPSYKLEVRGRVATVGGDFFVNNAEPTILMSNNYVTPYFTKVTSGATPQMQIFNNDIIIDWDGNVLLNGFTSATIGLIVKGAASQSANLQEWQNSSGDALAYIDDEGSFYPGTTQFSMRKLGMYVGNRRSIYSSNSRMLIDGDGLLQLSGDGAQPHMVIDENGSVGIGTNSPTHIFEVVSSAAVDSAHFDFTAVGANSGLTLLANSSYNAYTAYGDEDDANIGRIIYRNPTDEMAFYTNNAEQMIIDNNGKVGIGTSNPSSILHVLDASDPYILIEDSGDGYPGVRFEENDTAGLFIEYNNNVGYITGKSGSQLKFYSDNVETLRAATDGTVSIFPHTSTAEGLIIKGAASQSANLQEWQNSSGDALTVVDENGHIGIGVNPPVAALHIVGRGDFYLFDDGSDPRFLFGDTIGSGNYGGMQWKSSVDTLTLGPEAASFQLKLTEDGRVGIGPDWSPDAQLAIDIFDNATVGLIVQGNSTQTVNLQEWQNSSADTLAFVNPTGGFSATGAAYDSEAYAVGTNTGIYGQTSLVSIGLNHASYKYTFQQTGFGGDYSQSFTLRNTDRTNPAAPTYSFTGMNDAGMFAPVTNNLGWSTEAVERMRLNSTGAFMNESGAFSQVCTPGNGLCTATTYYNATLITVVTGTPQGTNTSINSYNGVAYNVSEAASDLDLILNFTVDDTINQFVIRYKTAASEPHGAYAYLWDYDDGAWESYGLLSNTEGEYTMRVFGVFDSSKHVSSGKVAMRIYMDNGPPSQTHKWSFDWITVSKGIATPSGTEIDPLSIHRSGDVPLTGNWAAGNFNITINGSKVCTVGNGLCNATGGVGMTQWLLAAGDTAGSDAVTNNTLVNVSGASGGYVTVTRTVQDLFINATAHTVDTYNTSVQMVAAVNNTVGMNMSFSEANTTLLFIGGFCLYDNSTHLVTTAASNC